MNQLYAVKHVHSQLFTKAHRKYTDQTQTETATTCVFVYATKNANNEEKSYLTKNKF